jgi:hypothetical protein
MKAKQNSIFIVDENTKQLIKEVSTLFGIKAEVVKEIFEYITFVWILNITENPDEFTKLTIPFLGNIDIKFKKDFIGTDGSLMTEVESNLTINDTFKTMISDLHDSSLHSITDYLKENYINKLVTPA